MFAKKPSFLTLLLLISFASVNAVLFTGALPEIAHQFAISENTAQLTLTWFLCGYAFGQLIYGPLANRLGRKQALYSGILLQMISSVICIVSGYLDWFSLLIMGRFLLALGSGVGLKMTFTLVHECYEHTVAAQKIAYLTLAFAVTPGLSVALGSFLTKHYGWQSCFYAGAIYGLILLLLTTRLPETKTDAQSDALRIRKLVHNYRQQLQNQQLILGGALMGAGSSLVYAFAALAPFIGMNILGLKIADYGLENMLPTIGLLLGGIVCAQFAVHFSIHTGIKVGVAIVTSSVIMMIMTSCFSSSPLLILFIPMMLCYFGMSFIFANASSLAMRNVSDKANGSAIMNFINMGSVTGVILVLNFIPIHVMLLPIVNGILAGLMMMVYAKLSKTANLIQSTQTLS